MKWLRKWWAGVQADVEEHNHPGANILLASEWMAKYGAQIESS